MIRYFQNKYAMSEEGARDFGKSIFWTVLLFLSFMLPPVLGFRFLDEYLVSGAPSGQFRPYLILTGVSFVIMFVFAYIQYDSTYTRIYGESARQRLNLAETLRKLPLAFFGKKDISDLSATIMEDATSVEQIFSHTIPQLYASIINVFLFSVMLFFYNWKMSIALLWVVPVAAFVFFLSRKFQGRTQKKLYDQNRDISENIQEELDLIHEIKSYNREETFTERLNGSLNRYESTLINLELLIGATINLSYMILKLGLPTVILAGAYMLYAGTADFTVFTYLVFLVVASRIYAPLMQCFDNFAALIMLNVRINRMKEMDAMPRQTGKTDFNPRNYDIEFDNVDFSYLGNIQTLNNVCFTAKQGEITALVGPSGGGKSTVAKLAARFWDVNGGKVTLGGEDISRIDPETLLRSFSIVFQDVTLFNSSVMENIRLGKKDASDDEVREAARLAQCDEFASRLHKGYDTLIGENGEMLSGGERQRISIARAILKDAPIILLDEATASLDAENESKIQAALSELTRDKTVLIIAHRMRTVSGADKIVVLKDGSVAESGSPGELNEQNGIFASMLRTQFQTA